MILSSTRRAFSLTELIAAIAIVAIVAVMAFSGLRFVSERSSSIRCLANLKSLHTATFAYAADHQGQVPVDATNKSTGNSWYMAIKEGYLRHPGYGKRVPPYFCLANRRGDSVGGNDGWTNYAINGSIYQGGSNLGGVPAGSDDTATAAFLRGRRGPRFQSISADRILYLDSRNSTGGTWYTVSGKSIAWPDTYPVHGDSVNLIFVGGHARAVRVFPRNVDSEGNLVDLKASWF